MAGRFSLTAYRLVSKRTGRNGQCLQTNNEHDHSRSFLTPRPSPVVEDRLADRLAVAGRCDHHPVAVVRRAGPNGVTDLASFPSDDRFDQSAALRAAS